MIKVTMPCLDENGMVSVQASPNLMGKVILPRERPYGVSDVTTCSL